MSRRGVDPDPDEALAALADEKYIGYKVLASAPELHAWMKDTVLRNVRAADAVQGWKDDHGVHVNLYTAEHVFLITACPPSVEEPQGYLGCFASAQRMRPGERHCRGNDLHDGAYSKETWLQIVGDMLSFEILPLANSAYRGDPSPPRPRKTPKL